MKNGEMKQYLSNEKNCFKIFTPNKEKLFEFGEGDIVVFKSNRKEESYCRRSDKFDYNNEEDNFNINKKKTFNPKRIMVFETKLNDEILKEK